MLMRRTSEILVKEVSSRRDRIRFQEFPYKLYCDSKYWVPPLRILEHQLLHPRKNPFFLHSKIHSFLAYDQNGEVVGRIAAIKNGMHLKKYNDATGFFGFFEAIESYDVANALLEAASDWLKANGLTAMRGPASPSMNDLSGLLVKGFDSEPSFFMPYNFPYYEGFLLQNGFSRAMTMSAYYIHQKFLKLTRVMPTLEAVYRHHPTMKVRTMDRKKIPEQVRTLVDIHNDAFSDNWGHVPFTDEEFSELAKLFKYFVDPDLVLFLELDGTTIGFTVCLPNFNEAIRYLRDGRLFPFGWLQLLMRSKFGGIRNVRSVLTGVRSAFRGHGFDAVLCYEGAKRGMEKHYEGCELSWILDSNRVVVNSLEAIGGTRDKEYAMFEKGI